MQTFTRRQIIAGAAALAGSALLPRYARAAEFIFKIASDTPASHPCNVRTLEAAERIKEETGGRVEIRLFPNNQLGAGPDMLGQLRSGALEFFMYSTQLVAPLVAHCALPGVGFAFKDTNTALSAMDGELGGYLRKQIEKSGLITMPKVWTSGYRQVTSSEKPILTPGDFDGFKIRVPASPMWVSLFKGFGASPTAINFSELYTSLQTKVVNGQENPLVIIETNRLFEVQQYCALTNHMWDAYWVLGNRRAWGRLPADLQAVVSKHFDQSALDQRADMAKQELSLRDSLGAKGLKFNDIEIDAFRQKLAASGYYADWKQKFGPEAWSILEKYAGALS
ncbi:TRAP transporter substrate-binding protein [Achromobacter veterisilvae]|jgi:tripartite ATP-independent transporter DctP family solute receptor|uniref:2,3-diketo-L-gulonate-binding periplasmic protein YiaO n=1 Tax=Achromobacter veterisilvae TaxID=2069367 RepID=A0A446CNB5_9BURK|nr:TRAP transporter substrate-binding protein [Achromobacter veterisilvae]SSW69447.1 2,3-diketo-L-gulonate-binding periplasmic protein YiaO [Achromobacter veterisilvae]